MKSRTLLVIATAIVVVPAPASAQQVATSPRPAGQQFGDLFRAPTTAGPYVRLQLPSPLPHPTTSTSPAVKPPTVVCGMTLVPGDATIDKGIQHDTPKDRRFAIQAIEPQVCRR